MRVAGLCEGVGHQPTRKQEPHLSAGLSGKWESVSRQCGLPGTAVGAAHNTRLSSGILEWWFWTVPHCRQSVNYSCDRNVFFLVDRLKHSRKTSATQTNWSFAIPPSKWESCPPMAKMGVVPFLGQNRSRALPWSKRESCPPVVKMRVVPFLGQNRSHALPWLKWESCFDIQE